MDYPTFDLLPDLTSAEKVGAADLSLLPRIQAGTPWDRGVTVSGSEPDASLRDIFKFTAIQGATYDLTSVSYVDPFSLRVYDKFGNVVVYNESDVDDAPVLIGNTSYLADQISDWEAPYTGVFYVKASWQQDPAFPAYSLRIDEDINTVGRDQTVRFYAGSGFGGLVAGYAEVYGTNGVQRLELGPGSFLLDPSFNRGGDEIVVPGNATDYMILRSGSNAVLFGYGSDYQLPIGTAGLPVTFDDGTRVLLVTPEGTIKFGQQVVDGQAAKVTDPGSAPPAIGAIDTAATARIFTLAAAQIVLGGDYTVFGTPSQELVGWAGGDLILDPSFNRGGDTLFMNADASAFTARLSGSSVVIRGADGSVTVPVGAQGMTIDFAGEERVLLFNQITGAVLLGNRQVTGNETTLG